MNDITNKSINSYEPPESLWQLIKENVNGSELDAIKAAIGESLVDTSIELHSEIETLLDIWREYRQETECNNDQIIRNNSNKIILPEPPDQRQRLIKEINLFVKQMREKYDDKLFSKQLVSNNHNLNVINYALNKVTNGSDFAGGDSAFSSSSTSCFTPKLTERPMSSMSKSGKETPCTTFRARNNCSVLSSTLECVEEKLNCMQIDDIVDRLRETLQEEIDILLKDVDFIHECLDKESEYRSQSKMNIKEPTLNELKEERKRLEEHILTSNNTAALQRPISGQSNHSLSSINISLKSPSPSPAPTPPLSASSSRYQSESPQISFRNKVPLTLTNLTKTGIHSTTTTKKPLTTSTTTSTNGNGINKSTTHTHNNSIRTTTTMGLTASNNTNTVQQPQIKGPLASKRIDNRSIDNLPNATASSASLRSTSVSSTARSKVVVPSAAKPSSAEKFRKMVLESRDSP